MKRFLLLLFLSGLSTVSPSWCQNPNTPWLPVGLNGETGPISTLGESGENELSLGVSVSGAYYGAASSNSGQENLGSYSVAPDIAITESRPRFVRVVAILTLRIPTRSKPVPRLCRI